MAIAAPSALPVLAQVVDAHPLTPHRDELLGIAACIVHRLNTRVANPKALVSNGDRPTSGHAEVHYADEPKAVGKN
jgi:hypothetical protein